MARYLDPELHELVSHLRSELSEQNSEMRALQAENEQLQAEVDLMRKMDEPTLVALQQKDAEIEWLKTDMRQAAKLNMELMEIRRNNEAEIERLRAAMDLREEDHKRKTAEIERLRGEATQLRQALGMLTTLHPTMEIDVNNPMQMAKEIVSYVTESRDTEIERLRELLREAHLALSFMPDPTRKLLDLRYRVREALGE